MEILYNNENKTIEKPSNFEDLKEKSLEIFKINKNYIKNITFKTEEDDNLENQEDFEIIIDTDEKLKLIMNVTFNEDYLEQKINKNDEEENNSNNSSLKEENNENNNKENFDNNLLNKIFNKLTNIENSINNLNNKIKNIEENYVKTESNSKFIKEILVRLLKNKALNQTSSIDNEKKKDVSNESISLLKNEYESKITNLKSEIEKEKAKTKKLLSEYINVKKKIDYNFEFLNNQISLNKTRKDLLSKSSSLEINIKNSGKNPLPNNIKLQLENNKFFEIMCKPISKNIEPEKTETINIVLTVKNEKLFLTDKNNKYVLKFYLVENENLNRIGNECLFININIQNQNNFIDDEISSIIKTGKKSTDDFFSTNDNNFIDGFSDNNTKENDIIIIKENNNNEENDNKVKNKSNKNIKKIINNDILTEEDYKNFYNKLNDEYNLETNFKKINYDFIKNKINEIIKTKKIKIKGNKENVLEDIYNDLILLLLDTSI
jgi:hypothetical protein